MIRVATQADVPEILNIYAPYIETTTVTFEYTVPSLEEFTERFRQVTEGFPWLLWEEGGKILATPTPAFPSSGRPTAGAPSPLSICGRRPGENTLAKSSTRPWRSFCGKWATSCPSP